MNKFEQLREYFQQKLEDPKKQRQVILVIVCVALLLDNMLYMVIVPIIPTYLREIHALGQEVDIWKSNWVVVNNVSKDLGKMVKAWNISGTEDAQIGVLFASKAMLQLLINPITGTIIDRIGYDIPMMIGLFVIFLSTIVFAFGQSYSVMFMARSLQGLGSAFADTSGLAMIADRYTEEAERSKALGIALAFISFGCLVAPPFGGILYQLFGKEFPFVALALIALVDGFFLIMILKPDRLARRELKAVGELPKGTPIYILLLDPYVAICAGALAMSNVSLAFLEPTISSWMIDTMDAQNWQMGLIWLPAFVPHVMGVVLAVKIAAIYPEFQWLVAAIGLAIEGVSCLFIPLCTNYVALMFPICFICFGIALVDTAILPTMGFLVDTRHVSVYGSVYAIADIFYSLAYAFGPIVAGGLVQSIKFSGLNIAIFLSNILFVPVIYFLKNIYKYKEFENDADKQGAGGDGGAPGSTKEIPPTHQRTYMMNGSQLEPKAGSLDVNGGCQPPPPSEKDSLVPEVSRPPPPRPPQAPPPAGIGRGYQPAGGVETTGATYGGVQSSGPPPAPGSRNYSNNPAGGQPPTRPTMHRTPDQIRQDSYGY